MLRHNYIILLIKKNPRVLFHDKIVVLIGNKHSLLKA